MGSYKPPSRASKRLRAQKAEHMSNDNLNSSSGLNPVSDSISNGIQREAANNDQKQGLSVSSQVVVGPIKKVDFGNADSRGDVAAASLGSASSNGGPRKAVGQFPLSGKQGAAARTKNFTGNLADSDAGN
jgi:hypothetical protein